jgi:hypothetical protein
MEQITFKVKNKDERMLLVAFAKRIGSVVVVKKEETRLDENSPVPSLVKEGSVGKDLFFGTNSILKEILLPLPL